MDIVKYIDYKVESLKSQYPDIDFEQIRNNAILSFSNRTEPLEVLKQYIDVSFANAVTKLTGNTYIEEEPFVMTPQEEQVYQELKQENFAKRSAMGLGNGKKLILEKPSIDSNKGGISLFGIIAIVAVVVVSLAILVWKVIF